MTFSIDIWTYDKARLHPLIKGQLRGYNLRTITSKYRSVTVHTTNGPKGSTAHAEAMYLVNSNKVAADYFIGKDGYIAQILDPMKYTAWHAGEVRAVAYTNLYSIGIEMHNTPSEGHCTSAQLNALDWLVRRLMVDHAIDYKFVDTHRFTAIPAGRKIDPSGFPDSEFYAWRETLHTKTYQVISTEGVNIRQQPKVANNIAGTLNYLDTFISDLPLKHDENGQVISGTDLWAHILHGTSNGVPVDGLGFVHLSNLKEI